MKIFTSGPYSTNCYLVVCEETQEGVLIDAAPGSASAIQAAGEDLVVKKILITHSHWDHIADCKALVDHFGAEVYLHKEDAENLRHPGADELPNPLSEPIQGVEPAGFLTDGEAVQVGRLHFTVLHAPGHSPGQICFYLERQGALFCGDLFFKGAMGSLALPTAQPERMWASLERMAALPKETVVYPGHGPSTTVGAESWLSRAETLYGKGPFEKGDDPWSAK